MSQLKINPCTAFEYKLARVNVLSICKDFFLLALCLFKHFDTSSSHGSNQIFHRHSLEPFVFSAEDWLIIPKREYYADLECFDDCIRIHLDEERLY